ncbi:hypothetical protein ACTFIR_008812 [Dictyostelium discoideum]
MIQNKSTPLTEFKFTKKNFESTSLKVEPINGIENGILIKNLLSNKECCLIKNQFLIVLIITNLLKKEFVNIKYGRIENYCVKKLKRKKNLSNSNKKLEWNIGSVGITIVNPKPGMAVIFGPTIIHIITFGQKQIMRSDLIYKDYLNKPFQDFIIMLN